jgi:hypothetical protein
MVVIVMLGIFLVVMVLFAGSTFMQIQLLERIQQHAQFSQAEIASNDLRQNAICAIDVFLFYATPIAFMAWFHRVYRNLRALGNKNVQYSTGWTIGAWFVPILGLFRPCQMMAETWKGSDPRNYARKGPPYGRTSPIVGFWWASFLVMILFGRLVGAGGDQNSPDSMIAVCWLAMTEAIIGIPAALLAILLVRGIDINQEQRFELIQQQPEPAPQPVTVDDNFPYMPSMNREPLQSPVDESEYPRFD